MKTYDFRKQLNIGEAGEEKLDTYFAPHFDISAVDMELQRLGIDRIFLSKKNSNLYLVEYKFDTLAHKTGNIYVETISVMKDSEPIKLGWAYTSQADFIAYHIEPNRFFVFQPKILEMYLEGWKANYRHVSVRNKGYSGMGVLVPIEEFSNIATAAYIHETENYVHSG